MIFTLSAAYPLPHPPYASYFMNISISILYWFCFCSFADKTMMDGGGGDHSEYNGHSLMPLLHFFPNCSWCFFVIYPSNNVVKLYIYMEQSPDDHDDGNFIEKNPLELMFAMVFFFNNFNAFFSFIFFCVFSTALCWWNLFSLEISFFFSAFLNILYNIVSTPVSSSSYCCFISF